MVIFPFNFIQVSTHHEDLLSQAASAHDLSGSLSSVRAGLTDLDTSLEKCVSSPTTPHSLPQGPQISFTHSHLDSVSKSVLLIKLYE